MTCQEQISGGSFILLFFTKSSKKFDLNPHDLFRISFDKTRRDSALAGRGRHKRASAWCTYRPFRVGSM
jgi:hypothetical protein